MIAANVKTSDLKNRDLNITIDGDVDLSNTVNTINGDKYVGVDFFPSHWKDIFRMRSGCRAMIWMM
jgi:hypothetical protein